MAIRRMITNSMYGYAFKSFLRFIIQENESKKRLVFEVVFNPNLSSPVPFENLQNGNRPFLSMEYELLFQWEIF